MQDTQTKSNTRVVLEDIYHTHAEKISAKKRKNRDSQILLFIIVLGISGLGFGFWRMGNIIQKPLHTITALDMQGSYSEVDINERLAISPSTLSLQDTDGDGLNDSDEMNIFNTSPYLEDTDSDGVNDSEEIKKGTDPNCLGDNCNGKIQDKNLQPLLQGDKLQAKEYMAPQGGVSASYLRSLLITSGISFVDVQQLSDTEILDIYNSILPQGNQVSSPATNLNAAPPSADIGATENNNLQKMPPAELREFLKKGGMSQEMLDTFSDEEILQVLKETINQ